MRFANILNAVDTANTHIVDWTAVVLVSKQVVEFFEAMEVQQKEAL